MSFDPLKSYNEGLQGVKYEPEHFHAFMASLKHPLFGDAGIEIAGSGRGKLSMPFILVEKILSSLGIKPFTERQTCSDCVSHGTRNAVDITRACEILMNNDNESFVTIGATEGIYGARGYSGDGGMSCSRAAQFVSEVGGVLLRKKYGDIDLTKYNGSTGIRWGRGVPKEIVNAAKKNQVKTVSLVTTLEQLRDALANGYGVACCSGQGFSSTRDKDGFCRAQGSWAHCFLSDTYISGENGKFIQDIKVGDMVCGHDGKEHKVTEVFKHKHSGDMVKIKIWGLKTITVTPEHPILVYKPIKHHRMVKPSDNVSQYTTRTRGGVLIADMSQEKLLELQNKQAEWVMAKDVQKDDYILTPALVTESDVELPKWELPKWELTKGKTKNVPKDILEPTDDLAWLFGLYIGDGNMVADHKIVITIGKHENVTIARAVKVIQELGIKAHVYEFSTYVRITVYSSILAKSFLKWFGGHSHSKHIPSFLYHGWNLQEVVNGLWCADGCEYKNRVIINTVSKKLAYQVYQILISNGEYCNIEAKYKTGGYDAVVKRLHYTLTWLDNPSKKTMSSFWKNNLCHKVKGIEIEHYDGDVYNFEVEDVNSYIADGISVHNCMAIGGFDDKSARKGALIINSWGAYLNGPSPEWGTLPVGGFMAELDVVQRMLNSRGTFAFSNVDGFPTQDITNLGFDSYL